MEISRETTLEMYRRMVRIREFELAAIDLFKRGMVKGAIHAYIGQEASAVGVCMALRHDDLIAGTHRSHGHNIAKGADTKKMMAEILGKETGYCKGRGGSMHIAAFETGSLGALAVVGAGIPIAVGAALAFKLRGEDRVAVPFTGDAGCNTGNWHEGLNMASIWDLPVVFVLENNQYGVSTRITNSCKIKDLSLRAQSYGIPGVRVDGFDVLAVYQAAKEAVERARRGEGPTLLVTESYRFEGHYAGEPEVYRDRAEVQEWRKKDPIPRFRNYLLEEGIASEGELAAIEAEVRQEIADAVKFAQESPQPDPATAMDYIYA
ncbi:MAG: pyruvate dehydrogenase (acetyl-transferring) E1 component subunit alpha [Ardenticatenia bacterium]|jgi:pyruvate dehydrogenase E1 component alpha subunit|nr:MAG: pyruvate dehydrogenase (acetyl-transferring) E1 component subunit alpha [Ardenticatenia bacterium]